MTAPTLAVEHSLFAAGHRVVAGMDEVGRGAIAGPVAVGVMAISVNCTLPQGVRDSKLLTPTARESMAELLATCGVARAVGQASAAEIDEVGIVAALQTAGLRALAALALSPDIIVLDGKHNWLQAPSLFASDEEPYAGPVHMRVKGDLTCASVAAASILAKVVRDRYMTERAADFPAYEWHRNKGYGSGAHLAAIEAHGLSAEHRSSWRIGAARQLAGMVHDG